MLETICIAFRRRRLRCETEKPAIGESLGDADTARASLLVQPCLMNAIGQSVPQPDPELGVLSSELAARIDDFCSAPDLRQRTAALVRLTRSTRSEDSRASPERGQQSIAHYMEANPAVRARFQASGAALLRELNSLSLFAEAGIPSDHSLLSEIAQRLAAKFLPSAQWGILRFIVSDALRSPLQFIFPQYGGVAAELPAEDSEGDEALGV